MSFPTVLITRDELGNRELAEKLKLAGFAVISWPSMVFEELCLDSDQQKKLEEKYDWLVLTSSHAARFFFEKFKTPAPKPSCKKIAVVGERTRDQVEKSGLSVDLVARFHSAVGLASEPEFAATGRLRILLPQALDARPDFVTALAGRHEITGIAIYKKVQVEKSPEEISALKTKNIDWIMFFSPSAVIFFLQDFGGEKAGLNFLQGKKIAAIGQTTLKHLKNYHTPLTVLASQGDVDHLISLMGSPIRSR